MDVQVRFWTFAHSSFLRLQRRGGANMTWGKHVPHRALFLLQMAGRSQSHTLHTLLSDPFVDIDNDLVWEKLLSQHFNRWEAYVTYVGLASGVTYVTYASFRPVCGYGIRPGMGKLPS
jgi:hypothetical protein